jgi:hypothetical protein
MRTVDRNSEQIAREFGITRAQARDRVHRARTQGYLEPGTQGRAGATIGPRLKELGWNPPHPHPRTQDIDTDEQPG